MNLQLAIQSDADHEPQMSGKSCILFGKGETESHTHCTSYRLEGNHRNHLWAGFEMELKAAEAFGLMLVLAPSLTTHLLQRFSAQVDHRFIMFPHQSSNLK
ncbi:hypothetical protein Ancab_003198 [Ancistrocladus abbreviatus]